MADFSRNFRIGDSHGDRNDINSEGVRFCGACYVCTDGDKLSCLSKAIMMALKMYPYVYQSAILISFFKLAIPESGNRT